MRRDIQKLRSCRGYSSFCFCSFRCSRCRSNCSPSAAHSTYGYMPMWRLRVMINASRGAAAVSVLLACSLMFALHSLAQKRRAVCVCSPARCRSDVKTDWSHMWLRQLASSVNRQSTSWLHLFAMSSTERVAALPFTYPCTRSHELNEMKCSSRAKPECHPPRAHGSFEMKAAGIPRACSVPACVKTKLLPQHV